MDNVEPIARSHWTKQNPTNTLTYGFYLQWETTHSPLEGHTIGNLSGFRYHRCIQERKIKLDIGFEGLSYLIGII